MSLYINCVQNIDLLCWVYKKTNSFLSFHSPILNLKIRRDNSLKRTYVEGGVHVKRTGTNKRAEEQFWANVFFECPQMVVTRLVMGQLTVFQKLKDGINWFFACWCKFRQAKSWFNDFWVCRSKLAMSMRIYWKPDLS